MDKVKSAFTFVLGEDYGRAVAFSIGVFVTAVLYQNFIMIQKDTQLDSKQQLIYVKEDRIKAVNDQIDVLKLQLAYKPYKDKKEFEDLESENIELSVQNANLSALLEEVKTIDNSKDIKQFADDIAKLKSENIKLTNELATYISDIVVHSERVSLGHSWSGFGGVVVFGLDRLSASGYGEARLSVNGETTNKRIYPGDQFTFEVANTQYILNVLSVEYVASQIKIGVSKKI
ncbi:hypothetical protein [Vibrio lentus]|uniref:hypothetical protein n=1 Tax=Vibrio lentus TaxID=136468 RepID=UPI000C826911|nr:hypothetical protein [Vibrio lentus]PMG99736.1 hypothetical protein BCU78_19135 [Vibrio lentus]